MINIRLSASFCLVLVLALYSATNPDRIWHFPQSDGKKVTFQNVPDWGTDGFTLEVWCRPAKSDCGYAVLMRGAFGYPNFFAEQDINCYLVNTDGKSAAGRVYTHLEPGKYHYYCLTGTASSCIAWRDGKLMRENPGNGIPKYTFPNTLYVGNSIGWADNFDGEVALVRIHKRALTEAEIKANYELLQKGERLNAPEDTIVFAEDRRFPEAKKSLLDIPGNSGDEVTLPLDNASRDSHKFLRSRHLEGKNDYQKPLVDFEDLEGWTITFRKDEVVPLLSRSQEEKLWGNHVLRAEFCKGPLASSSSKVVLRPPQPIVINEVFDTICLWRFATTYNSKSIPKLQYSVQIRDAKGKLHDTERMGSILEEGWGISRVVFSEEIAIPAVLESITFAGFNEESRVLYLDNLSVYERSRKSLPDATVPSYAELGAPTRLETILPTPTEAAKSIVLQKQSDSQWSFVSEFPSGRKLQFTILPKTGTFSDISVQCDGRSFTPMQGGGFHWATDNIYPVAQSSLLAPGNANVRAKLLQAEAKGNALTLQWEYIISDTMRAAAVWNLSVRDNSLILDLRVDEPVVGECKFGAVAGVSGKVVEFPMLTLGRWIHDSNPPGIFTADKLYVSAFMDWYNTDSSGLFGESSSTPGGHYELNQSTADHRWVEEQNAADPSSIVRDYSVINGGSYYWPKTDGKRNPLHERIFLTVGDTIASVLPNIPNPVRPTLHLTDDVVWATRMWYCNLPNPEYFEREFEQWKACKDYGMEKLNIRLHGNINRMYDPRPDGDPSTFIKSFTEPRIGGDEGLAKFFGDIRDLGFGIGIYTDHMILSPLAADAYEEDMLNLDSNGALLYSSGTAKQTKISRMVALQKKFNAIYRENFGPTCAYLDQITCPPFCRYTDYDQRVPEAAKCSAVWRVFAQSLRQEEEDFGPVLSEGKTQWFFAGLCDSYAQTQRMKMNLLPDFNLRKIHLMNNDCGAELTWINHKASGYSAEECCYKVLALEYAYGSTGHLVGNYHGAPTMPIPAHLLRSYFLIQPAQKFFVNAPIRSILYNVNGKLVPIEEAIDKNATDSNQLLLTYENGLQVAVNIRPDANFTVRLHDREYTLPPDGFAAYLPGKLEACSALVHDKRTNLMKTDDVVYVDGLSDNGVISAVNPMILKVSESDVTLTPAPYVADETVTVTLPFECDKVLLRLEDQEGRELSSEQLPVSERQVAFNVGKAFRYIMTPTK